MAIAKRSFGKPPSLKDSLVRGKEYIDAVMELPVSDILDAAPHKSAIGRTAAKMTGTYLQLEGDYDSQQLILAAYDGMYDLLRPTLEKESVEATVALFDTATTRSTLLELSRTLKSRHFGAVALRYAKHGEFLTMTEDGLRVHPTTVFPRSYDSTIGGCPYARAEDARYFNQFTSHIVETFAQATSRDMPHNRLDRIVRRH